MYVWVCVRVCEGMQIRCVRYESAIVSEVSGLYITQKLIIAIN